MPNSIDVITSQGDVAEACGDWKTAVAKYQKAIQLEPLEPNWVQTLANLYLGLRNYAEAELLVNRAIATLPQEVTGQLWGLKRYIAMARGDTKAAMAAIALGS